MNDIMEVMDASEVHFTRALAGAMRAFKKGGITASSEALNAGAATILIHARDLAGGGRKPSGGGGGPQRGNSRPKTRSAGQIAPEACPKCGGDMWDNSTDKRNPRAPDYKCKDRDCDGAVWLDSKKGAGNDEMDAGYSRAVAMDDYDPFADE